MGLWKESKEKVENEKKARINKEMSKKRVLEKRDLTQSEINKIKREVEQEYKRARALRKRIAYFVAGALSIVGVTVGGHALLNAGDETPKEEKTAIESTTNTEQETTRQEKSARDAYLEELQEYNTEVTFETQNEENIVEEILESYNANLETSEKIDKDNLGIIKQEDMGEGHFLKTISEDGTVSYEEVLIKTDDDRQENQEWVESDDVRKTYVLVDTQNQNTIAGVGLIEGDYHEIDVQEVRDGAQRRYIKDDQTYVGLPEDAEPEESYQSFANYYQERLKNLEQKEQQNDGWDR